MKLCFDTVEELRAFVKDDLKAKRGAKGDTADEGVAATGSAPPPLLPVGGAVQGFNPNATQGFAPPVGGAAPMGGAFPAAAAPTVAPEILALVQRITTKLDAALAGGQSADQALAWFRGECQKGGIDASNYTLDQVKQNALPKLGQAILEGIAKLMAA